MASGTWHVLGTRVCKLSCRAKQTLEESGVGRRCRWILHDPNIALPVHPRGCSTKTLSCFYKLLVTCMLQRGFSSKYIYDVGAISVETVMQQKNVGVSLESWCWEFNHLLWWSALVLGHDLMRHTCPRSVLAYRVPGIWTLDLTLEGGEAQMSRCRNRACG